MGQIISATGIELQGNELSAKLPVQTKPISGCELLLNLITELQVEILVRWLSLHDVVKLDLALLSSDYHETFLKLLDDEHCVFRDLDGEKHLAWVLSRNVKLSMVDLPRSCSDDQRLKLFQGTGKYLRFLSTVHVNLRFLSTVNVNLRFSNNFVEEISTFCPNLEKLAFKADLSEMDICSNLSYLPRLQDLDLRSCENLTAEMFTNIRSHASLVSVNLSTCSTSKDASPVHIVNDNYTIRSLYVQLCTQPSFFLPFVLQCKALNTLSISGIRFADVLTILTQCPALTALSAADETGESNILSHDELNRFISLIQNLQVLHLHRRLVHNWNWQQGQLESLVKGAPNLHAFFLGRLNNCQSDSIAEILQNVHKLTPKRTIASASKHQLHTLLVESIGATALQSILHSCPLLVCLTIYKCGDIKADAQALITPISNSRIKILEIAQCYHLESADFLSLRDLIGLKLILGVELNRTDLKQLLQQNPSLRQLALIKCTRLNDESIFQILKMCPALEVLEFDNNFEGAHMFGIYHNGRDTTRLRENIKQLYPALTLSVLLRN